MDYKGYHIIAEINVNSQWDFTERENGTIEIFSHIDQGEADEDNLADFLILDPEGEDIGWHDTLAGAKLMVDVEIKNREKVANLRSPRLAGYLWGVEKNANYTDQELLEASDLKDRLAAIHNAGVSRAKTK
jgi:hypothetical protein